MPNALQKCSDWERQRHFGRFAERCPPEVRGGFSKKNVRGSQNSPRRSPGMEWDSLGGSGGMFVHREIRRRKGEAERRQRFAHQVASLLHCGKLCLALSNGVLCLLHQEWYVALWQMSTRSAMRLGMSVKLS